MTISQSKERSDPPKALWVDPEHWEKVVRLAKQENRDKGAQTELLIDIALAALASPTEKEG